ncbi:TPA: hypothetical protein HA361_01135 [Candidatus Woesearchaeota archaeon]|nr:hypothetical protein [Candidatus Woesearchaeota archaeon]HII68862.1 hypothetical protein [Candidatus Woesearchaeota archaeon]
MTNISWPSASSTYIVRIEAKGNGGHQHPYLLAVTTQNSIIIDMDILREGNAEVMVSTPDGRSITPYAHNGEAPKASGISAVRAEEQEEEEPYPQVPICSFRGETFDRDGNGFPGWNANDENNPNLPGDLDGDGLADASDPDQDGDGTCDNVGNLANAAGSCAPDDTGGYDNDDDHDGIPDDLDWDKNRNGIPDEDDIDAKCTNDKSSECYQKCVDAIQGKAEACQKKKEEVIAEIDYYGDAGMYNIGDASYRGYWAMCRGAEVITAAGGPLYYLQGLGIHGCYDLGDNIEEMPSAGNSQCRGENLYCSIVGEDTLVPDDAIAFILQADDTLRGAILFGDEGAPCDIGYCRNGVCVACSAEPGSGRCEGDSDCDGIPDLLEMSSHDDMDNDGIPNWLDTDSNGDGILDADVFFAAGEEPDDGQPSACSKDDDCPAPSCREESLIAYACAKEEGADEGTCVEQEVHCPELFSPGGTCYCDRCYPCITDANCGEGFFCSTASWTCKKKGEVITGVQVTRYFTAFEGDYTIDGLRSAIRGRRHTTSGDGALLWWYLYGGNWNNRESCRIPEERRSFFHEVWCQGSGVTTDGMVMLFSFISQYPERSRERYNYQEPTPAILAKYSGSRVAARRTLAIGEPSRLPRNKDVYVTFRNCRDADEGCCEQWNGYYLTEDHGPWVRAKQIDVYTGVGKASLESAACIDENGVTADVEILEDADEEPEVIVSR